MLEYGSIKELAKAIKRPVTQLLALAQQNDPFYAGVGSRGRAAEWFADLWPKYGEHGAHLRRIHYKLLSSIALPSGDPYENTQRCWDFLCAASLAARYLGLIPADALIDRRNDEAIIHVRSTGKHSRAVACRVFADDPDLPTPEMPHLPFLTTLGYEGNKNAQDFIVEVWIEKSTQNDWLVPLCRTRGVNLVIGIGEQSETRSRELAIRAHNYGLPVRVLYISDFDPAGRSIPKAVARKVEFTVHKHELTADVQVIPVALTPEQCAEYDLPRTPIKETERRKDPFEAIFGRGATELDAMEALHPGTLARILDDEIKNWIDPTLSRRTTDAQTQQYLRLKKIEAAVTAPYAEQIKALSDRFDEITDDLVEWEQEAKDVWSAIAEDLEKAQPDLSDVTAPAPDVTGQTEKFVLYDSKRDYFTQLDHYHQWRDGDA